LFRPAGTAFFRGPASMAPSRMPEGRAVCAECGGDFAIEEMVRQGSLYVCAHCKPLFEQKLREGVRQDNAAEHEM
jgi:hypothetical protein